MAEKNSVAVSGKAEKAALVDQNCNATVQPAANGPDKGPAPERRKGSPYRQILAALVAQLGTINTGMAFGFSAIALPQLKNPNATIHIETDEEESWIASASAIGTPIGCLFSGYLMDVLGRKLSLIVTEVPALLGWLLIYSASDTWAICLGRFFTGLGSGMVGAPARVYTSEVSQPHLRGSLTAISSVGVSTGVLLEYALGAALSWRLCAGLSALLPAAALCLMFLCPETPSYLVSANRHAEARDALQKFRSTSYDLDQEMTAMLEFSARNNLRRLTGAREIGRALLRPNALRPFLLLTLYFLIYQWTGTNAVTFYAVEIVAASGVRLDKYKVTVCLGVLRLVCTVAACVACRRFGRRPMTFVSSLGCGLSMLGLGFFVLYQEPLLAWWPSCGWLPVACIAGYTVACTLGFLVVPWVMVGELYPVQIRGVVGGLTTMCAHAFVFSVVKTYPMLVRAISQHGTFFLYGCISLLGTLYFYLCLPETRNRTLQDIEDYFSGRRDDLKTGSILRARKGQVLPT